MNVLPLFSYELEVGPIHLVVWEVLYVIGLVLVLSVILNRLLFRPVLAVLDERKRRIAAAQAQQDTALKALEEASARHAERIGAARRDAQARLEAARSEAEASGRVTLEEAQQTAQGQVGIARDIVERSTKKAEADLKVRTAEMARLIASRVLDRSVA